MPMLCDNSKEQSPTIRRFNIRVC